MAAKSKLKPDKQFQILSKLKLDVKPVKVKIKDKTYLGQAKKPKSQK
jgi:hypothetical protein